MSALLTPGILRELERERFVAIDPAERCRFCGCQENSPCAIPVRQDEHGIFHLAPSEEEATELLGCSWFLPGICNRPECIEQLLQESRGKVILFDGRGERAL